jgi:tRNA (guanine37-N1)-methyltransferase
MKKIPQDILGDIAILKFPRRTLWLVRKFKAWRFLKMHPKVKTVVEKVEGFSGKLRVPVVKHLAGVQTKVATYRENGCVFRFDVDKTYFSSRLSNERKVIAEEIFGLVKGKGKKILVMFSGAGPYPVVIASRFKKGKKKVKIVSSELNSYAVKYSKENVKTNKVEDYVEVVGGDVKKLRSKIRGKFDVIVMPRPNLDETFLDVALKFSKKGTLIYYYGFGSEEGVLSEAKIGVGKKGSIMDIRKAGDIGVGRFRWLVKVKV